MKEAYGNLWNFDGVHCITTNGEVRRDGDAIMGRGCALEARLRWPELAQKLGTALRTTGNRVYYFWEYDLITFPVKQRWRNQASLTLIEKSGKELVRLVHKMGIQKDVYIPRPGCGAGGLAWEVVRPVLEPILTSDQFIIVTNEQEQICDNQRTDH